MSESKAAVVILNYNGKLLLEKFLPSVIKHSGLHAVFVIDNNSSDDSLLFLQSHFQQVQVIKNACNSGFSKGYNDGLKQIQADYYVLLNSDVEVTEHWIEPVVDLMDKNPLIAACQPKILDFNNKTRFEYAGASGGFIDKYGYPFCRGRVFNSLEEDKGQYNDCVEVFWATGACMFVRASAFHEVHGFDEDYFAHMEEIDLCWRLKNIGYSVYVQPKSCVYHVGGGTLNKISTRKTFLNFRNNLITLTKNHPPDFLFFKIIYRLKLDGIAALKFLMEGNAGHLFAVLKAHFAYYSRLPKTLQKRKEQKKHSRFKHNFTKVYKRNIVYDYFIKKKRTFSSLAKTTFFN